MALSPSIETERLGIVSFTEEHLTSRYVSWLNDPEVVRYSDQRHRRHTLESCRQYWQSFRETPNYFWALVSRDAQLGHIGTMTAYVDPVHLVADVGILIGERAVWGRGYGSEAWEAVCQYLLSGAGIRKVTAGTPSVNRAMLAIMRRSGMVEDGRRIGHCLFEGREVDVIYAARFRDNRRPIDEARACTEAGRNGPADLRVPAVAEGERLYLRPLRLSDVNEAYCRWMNDAEVIRCLESRFSSVSLESLREYVTGHLANRNNVLLAIVLKEDDRHIGNVKLGPINWIHRRGEVGILIGEKACWGKGYATEAIRLLVDYAFTRLGLHKLTAGCYSVNPASARAFLKAGFTQEAVRRQHVYCEGRYVDDVLVGIVSPE